MVATAFAVVATAEDEQVSTELSAKQAYEEWLMFKEMEYRNGEKISPTNAMDDRFTYTDGPYPEIGPNGAPVDVTPTANGNYFVCPVCMWNKGEPNEGYAAESNPGGGYSYDATGAAGDFTVGDTHEVWIGDQDGNGILEWISYFHYKPWDENGVDDDGDGCVDERTFGASSGQSGCDRVPDSFVYFETGGLPDAGGDDGSLISLVDWYTEGTTEIFRAFQSLPWIGAYKFRTRVYYPQIAGEHIAYYAYEGSNGINANPEMDSDQSDWYVGNIDARGFPAIPPTDHACSAGYELYMGITFQREDGIVVTSYELWESYDSHDWNGDGDQYDYVSAYYVVDPVSGDCRQGVNTGVYGWYPRNTGTVLTPGYTFESGDSRDWNGDGDTTDLVLLWHNIEARSDLAQSWPLVGPMYTSYTYTSAVPTWGFGWWGRYVSYGQFQTFPLKFGGSYYLYMGYPQYYKTFFFLTADEDSSHTTDLPGYEITYGMPSASPGGVGVQIYTGEIYMQYAGVKLIGNRADCNGDGDYYDYWCEITAFPDETGGTFSWLEYDGTKYAQGQYATPLPFYVIRYVYYSSDGNARGHVTMPGFTYEGTVREDSNGNNIIDYFYGHNNFQFTLVKPDFEIVELEWADGGYAQPGGTALVRMLILNTGGIPIKITEDKGIDNDQAYKIQGMSAVDQIGPDGVIVPGETAQFYFAMTTSAGAGAGILSPSNLLWQHEIEFFVTYGGVTKSQKLKLPLYLKMFGDHLSCYRHKQNALRTMRAFDMDDDQGMLDTDKWAAQMGGADPERELLLAIGWFENGCGLPGQNDVEGAHSYTASLTGSFGMGMEYWGFAPGQEEGNEGNGNGGLTGQDRKAAYGF